MMVRINLAPTRKRGPSGDTLWRIVAIMAVLLVAELVLLFWINSTKNDEIEQQQQILAQANQRVSAVESEIAAIPNLEAKVQEMKAREKELARIAASRLGPQHVLEELKRVLSRPTTKTSIKKAQNDGWDISWEAESVYLNSFAETAPGQLTIQGHARTLDDIAEFWLRLRTSEMFRNVRLHGISEAANSKAGVPVQQFKFTTDANFYYQTEEGTKLLQQVEIDQSSTGNQQQ